MLKSSLKYFVEVAAPISAVSSSSRPCVSCCGHTADRPAPSRSVLAWVIATNKLRPRIAIAAVFADSMAEEIAGKSAPIRMPRMPMTTRSSTSVKPLDCFFI